MFPLTASEKSTIASPNAVRFSLNDPIESTPNISATFSIRPFAVIFVSMSMIFWMLSIPCVPVSPLIILINGWMPSAKPVKDSATCGRLAVAPVAKPETMLPKKEPIAVPMELRRGMPPSINSFTWGTYLFKAPKATRNAPISVTTAIIAVVPATAPAPPPIIPRAAMAKVTPVIVTNNVDNAVAVSILGSTFNFANAPNTTAKIATTPDTIYRAVIAPVATFPTLLTSNNDADIERSKILKDAAVVIEDSIGICDKAPTTSAKTATTPSIINIPLLALPTLPLNNSMMANTPIKEERAIVAPCSRSGSNVDNNVTQTVSTPIAATMAMSSL